MSGVLVVLATARASAGRESAENHDRHLQPPRIATLTQRFDGVLVAAPPETVKMRPLA